jgi:hypothetical protein
MRRKKHKKEVTDTDMEAGIRAYFSKLGKRGGKAKAALMSPESRRRLARKAARARWSKQKGEKP